jgi:large subunit ribosomal protein L31
MVHVGWADGPPGPDLGFHPGQSREGKTMKDGIHPKYQDCTVTCGCGNTFRTRSTKPKIVIEVCSKCHPFYTGSVKFIDTAGRVDKFNKKFQGTYGKAKKKAAETAAKA